MIRGGSHVDFSSIPNQAFGASLRGPDVTDWYASAWFDKYVKRAPGADARLLSSRWRSDAVEAGVDPGHDGNAFSFYFHSRLDIGLAKGGRFGSALKSGSSIAACRARYSLRVRARRGVTRVKVHVDGRLVHTVRGRSVKVPALAGNRRHTVRLLEYKRKRLVRRVTRPVYGCAHTR